MAAARLCCMRQIKEVFCLHFNERRSQSEIAASLGVGKIASGFGIYCLSAAAFKRAPKFRRRSLEYRFVQRCGVLIDDLDSNPKHGSGLFGDC